METYEQNTFSFIISHEASHNTTLNKLSSQQWMECYTSSNVCCNISPFDNT